MSELTDSSRARHMRRAFTLIELLVVVAIIALLVSILLPSIYRAKRLAQTVKCMAHLNGFGDAAYLYSTDYRGYVPSNDYDWRDKYLFWALRLAPYLGISEPDEEEASDTKWMSQWSTEQEYFHCPGISSAKQGIDYTVNTFDWEAYKFNTEVRGWTKHDKDVYKRKDMDGRYSHAVLLDRIPVAPSSLLYLCEASNRQAIRVANISSDSHTVFNRWGEPKGGRMIKHNDKRHDGKTTFVCYDGHVETRRMTPENFPMSLYIPWAD